MFKLDLVPLAPKLLNNRDAHIDYIKHSREHADILRKIVEHARALRLLDSDLDSACKIVQRIQEVLVYVKDTCPSTVIFENDQIAKIIGYGDYQMGNVMISWVYYVEGLGHNLFSVGQFCDSDLEVAFRKHTCYIRDLEGKSKKHSYKSKDEDSIQEKLNLLHMDLCGPMRIQSINGQKYILVIIDDYFRFTWVNFLRSKDEVIEFVIKFLKMIHVRLNALVQNIRIDNGTEFVNQTLRAYYENDLGKLKPKADIGIFIGYAPAMKVFRIYNKRTQLITESIHVDFDELTVMASEQFSSGPRP
ncbi:retrovirus-related pol polyprotein from transposon TNT 1-94 [Tanacetum coccineum]